MSYKILNNNDSLSAKSPSSFTFGRLVLAITMLKVIR